MNEKDTQGDKQRLAEIDRRLDKLQAQREEKDRPDRSALPKGMAAIMGRVATELVAGVVFLIISLTSAIVTNAISTISHNINYMSRPTGIDVNKILVAQSDAILKSYVHKSSVEEDLQTIRSIPVVNSASISSYIPLSGYGISTDFRASLDEDAERLYANFFFVATLWTLGKETKCIEMFLDNGLARLLGTCLTNRGQTNVVSTLRSLAKQIAWI